ncbi:flagellin lysine-N-methylase [Selenomonas sp.]|uniref:flagellin lysine-N-methylase n=1 Tax=Selenomonas sp. TaxID=2053611 RepID=UPI0025DE73EA|nr:flagellin lysine-N-methylase [Selenomonas sp.]
MAKMGEHDKIIMNAGWLKGWAAFHLAKGVYNKSMTPHTATKERYFLDLITLYPDFYDQFNCKADKCQHTCCAGWEIDIDEETARKYQQMTGSLGEKIRKNIVEQGGSWQFRLDDKDRCPFLQADGLCFLIRTADESLLCEICRNHPRFFVTVGDYELAGAGLSCEKSCELLLADNGPLRFHDDAGETLTLESLLQRLKLPVTAEDLFYQRGITAADADFVLDCLKKTEPIDEEWTTQLQQLKPELIQGDVDAPQVFDRIYGYILYRALEHVPQYGLGTVLSYAQLNTDFIYLHSLFTGQLAESLRRWSEQIEYSRENVQLLLEILA